MICHHQMRKWHDLHISYNYAETVFKYLPSAPGMRRTVWLPVPVMSQCNATLFTSIFLDVTDDMHLHNAQNQTLPYNIMK